MEKLISQVLKVLSEFLSELDFFGIFQLEGQKTFPVISNVRLYFVSWDYHELWLSFYLKYTSKFLKLITIFLMVYFEQFSHLVLIFKQQATEIYPH